MLKKNAFGYKHANDTNVPLKNFVRCANCDTPFTGYVVKKKNLYYYKCNRIGCRCNRSANAMHHLFAALLKSYEVNRLYMSPLKEQFLHICEALTDSGKEDRLSMQQSLSTLNAKLEKLEERFAFGEVDREIFEKVGGKIKLEIKAIGDELKQPGIELSNPALLIDHSLEIISNLSAIPVERINGPILLLSAKGDEAWPSTLMCNMMVGRLKSKHFNYQVDHIALDGSHAAAAQNSEYIFDFLEKHFASK